MQPNNKMASGAKAKRPPDLGPKQKAWCDRYLPNFRIYRKGADSAIASTERSRRALIVNEKATA
jgi:hypothetical protein